MKLYPNVTIIFIIWLLAIFVTAYFGFLFFPHSGKFSVNFFENLSNWDGNYYLGIAEYGYSQNFLYAFFPLYPLIIRFITQLTQNFLISAVLINITATFLGFQLLYKLTFLDFDKKIAEKVILALIFFPTSFYFLVTYSEGLFFLLVVATFYSLRQNKLFLATIFAALASATRLVGLAVVLGLIIDVYLRFGINRKTWYVLLSPLGVFAYCLYLNNQTGDSFYFIEAEKYWQRSISIPGLGFWETLKSLSRPDFINMYPNIFLDLIFAIFGIGLTLRAFRFLPPALSFYAAFSILLPIVTSSITSMPRFILPVFPIFILIALLKNQYVNFTYQIISLMLLSVFAVLFINGYWVG